MIDRMTPQADQPSSQIQALLSQGFDWLDECLANFLRDRGIDEPAEALRTALIQRWEQEATTPEERYLALNLMRMQGPLETTEFVEMAIAARQEAASRVHHPSQALRALLRAASCLGYVEALDGIKLRSEQKKQAAKKSTVSKNAALLKADLLAFIDRHQPPEGWDSKQAIEHYAGQPFEQTSALVQTLDFDTYWADIASKINRWLHEAPDFAEAFESRLRGARTTRGQKPS